MANFEKDFKKLEEIVEKLQKGDIQLEESIKLYEEGKILADGCYDKLKKAELKVIELSPKEETN